jgi:hypothetical protein
MEKTSLPTVQQDKQLQTAYFRLWKRNEHEHRKKTRIHLFRLVLCSRRNLSYTALTQALQVSSGDSDDDDLDLLRLDEELVKSLGDDFLVEDSTGNVIFVHDSAKSFISSMKDKDVDNDVLSDALFFEAKRNHLYAAKLYITVASLPEHRLWQISGVKFSKRHLPSDYTDPCAIDKDDVVGRDLPLGVWLDTINRDRTGFLNYLVTHGLSHCRLATAKPSIFDAHWKNVLDKVIWPSNPAFLVCFSQYSRSHTYQPPSPFTYQGNQFQPLYAPIVSILNILRYDDFSDLEFANLKKCHADWSDRERRLALLLQIDPAKPSGVRAQVDALCYACKCGDETTVKFLLSGTYHLHGPQAVLVMLNTATDTHRETYAIREAIRHFQGEDNSKVLEMLLSFEKLSMEDINEGKHVIEGTGGPLKEQWLLPFDGFPALIWAILSLEEATVCHLIEIFRPRHIGMQDIWMRTPLHAAADRGYPQLVQKLVIDFGARTDIKDEEGRTALDCARHSKAYARSRVRTGVSTPKQKDYEIMWPGFAAMLPGYTSQHRYQACIDFLEMAGNFAGFNSLPSHLSVNLASLE